MMLCGTISDFQDFQVCGCVGLEKGVGVVWAPGKGFLFLGFMIGVYE